MYVASTCSSLLSDSKYQLRVDQNKYMLGLEGTTVLSTDIHYIPITHLLEVKFCWFTVDFALTPNAILAFLLKLYHPSRNNEMPC